MKLTRTLALAAGGLLAVTGLAACSSTSGSSDVTTAQLEARVTALENQVKGLESIVGKVIIADPAAQMKQLESEVAGLEKDLAAAQANASQTADAVAAQTTAAQSALDEAKKAASSAKEAVGDARAQAIIDAETRVADARAAIDELKAKIAAAVDSAAATPVPSAS
jgi:chromosome segregation ATPase